MKTKLLLGGAALAAALGAVSASGAAYVRNPSFESNYNDTWPHYSPVDEWTGASGVNDASGPFHNGGTPVPDRSRVGFKQGGGDITQQISGLVAGNVYWLQFFYDGRTGGGASESLVVAFDDTEIGRVADLRPSTGPYHFMSAAFTPAADTGTIKLTHIVSGDRTLLLDGVTVVARSATDIVLRNPSFEASGILPAVGGITNIAGWNQVGVAGVDDGTGGYATTGTIPDQDLVGYIEGAGSISQDLDGLIVGNEYEVRLAVNGGKGSSPGLQVKVGDTVLTNSVVSSGAYKALSLKFKAATTDPVLSIAQTKDGSDVLLVDDVRLLGVIKKPLPPMVFSPLAGESSIGQTIVFSLAMPAEVVKEGAVDIKLASSNPNAGSLVGAAADGVLTLHFNADPAAVAPVSQSFSVQTVGRGSAAINVVDAAKVPFSFTPSVNVVGSLVRNPSFESSAAGAFPGYGSILGWEQTGQTGLNRTDSATNPANPFGDNGLVPDREQVAFIQGNGSLSQQITSLTAGQRYWLQFWYNARGCCGDRSQKLTVRFGGKELTVLSDIKPASDSGSVNYSFANLPFVAEGTSGLLEFVHEVTGDASLVLDGVNIVPRAADEIVVRNPSFEASGSPPGVGYVQPYAMAGWDGSSGGRGINVDGQGPFTDNGLVPDQDRAALIQNIGFLSQTVSGLNAGQKYTLVVSLNGRNCCAGGVPTTRVSVDDVSLFEEDVPAVRARNPYAAKYLTFTAGGSEALVKIEVTGPAGADMTLLLDDVHIVPGTRTAPSITQQPGDLQVNGGETIALSGGATGSNLHYLWRRGGVALVNGGRVTGADTAKLTISGAKAEDAGSYVLTVSDGLGVVGTDPVTVDVQVTAAPTIKVTRNGTKLTISSEPSPLPDGFILQVAPALSGPWVDQPGVTTPVDVDIGTDTARFLRAVKP